MSSDESDDDISDVEFDDVDSDEEDDLMDGEDDDDLLGGIDIDEDGLEMEDGMFLLVTFMTQVDIRRGCKWRRRRECRSCSWHGRS